MLINGLKIALASTAVAAAVSVSGVVAHAGGPARSVASTVAQSGSPSPQTTNAANDPWD